MQTNFGRASAILSVFAGKECAASGSAAFDGPGFIGMKLLHNIRLQRPENLIRTFSAERPQRTLFFLTSCQTGMEILRETSRMRTGLKKHYALRPISLS